VTEGLPFWEPPSAVHVLAVPAEYSAAKGSQGRARALQYASLHSEAAAGDWVVHLGAASVLRERTVRRSRLLRGAGGAHLRPRMRRWTPFWRTWWMRRSACPPREAAASGMWPSTAASRRRVLGCLRAPARCPDERRVAGTDVRGQDERQLDGVPQRHLPRGGSARRLSVAGARALALLSLAFLPRLTSTCLPQYESTEAWSGVQQTFMLVPNEVCCSL